MRRGDLPPARDCGATAARLRCVLHDGQAKRKDVMAKAPQQAAAKWDASTAVGQQTWLDNLQRTTKPIVQAAIANRSVMQSNFQQATSPGGVWERRLEAV